MYTCSKCSAAINQPRDRCPKCGVLLSEIKCEQCGYIGGKTEFINNKNRCPECNTLAMMPHSSFQTSPDISSQLSPRIQIVVAAIIIHVLCPMIYVFVCNQFTWWLSGISITKIFMHQQWTAAAFVMSALAGLSIYEIMYRTRKWLHPIPLILYIILLTQFSIVLQSLPMSKLSFRALSQILYFRYTLHYYGSVIYFFAETAIIVGIAYLLICKGVDSKICLKYRRIKA